MRKRHKSILARFMEHVREENGHLIWTPISPSNKYGLMYIPNGIGTKGTNVPATHASWFLTTGNWPTKSVLHKQKCNTKACVKFEHLYEGTQTDNMNDYWFIRKHKQGILLICMLPFLGACSPLKPEIRIRDYTYEEWRIMCDPQFPKIPLTDSKEYF